MVGDNVVVKEQCCGKNLNIVFYYKLFKSNNWLKMMIIASWLSMFLHAALNTLLLTSKSSKLKLHVPCPDSLQLTWFDGY